MRHSTRRCSILLLVGILLMAIHATVAMANDDGWKIYASYHNASKAVKTDSRIFVLANGALFSYDTDDNLVSTYDKTNALSDVNICDIAYSSDTKQLLVLYTNGNIDILGMDGSVWNLPDLKNKPLRDNKINALKVVGSNAFVSINCGLVHVDMAKRYFVNFYNFDCIVSNANMADGKIYARTYNGTMEGDLKENLSNIDNWKKVDKAPVSFEPTQEEQDEAAAMLQKVSGIDINSPERNMSYKLNMQGQRLLMAGGVFSASGASYNPGTAMMYENGKWSAFDEEKAIEMVGSTTYRDVTDVVQDPYDVNHHWVGTARSGIYEFKNLQLVNHYTYDNSPITSIIPSDPNAQNLVRVTALNYDHDGNLWMCNNLCDTIVRILKKDRTWKAIYINSIKSQPTFDHTVFDRRGWAWMVSRRTTTIGPSGIAIVNVNGTIDDTSDDTYKYLSTFSNQNGVSYTPDLYYCVKEDLNGAMWIGCEQGVFMSAAPSQVFSDSFTFTQVVVPRNDGSGLGDYLLGGVPVKCIAIDGGNRKWIGTLSNGVYLVSADGQEIIEHFTADNSPLVSDEINDIAINGTTGEVFIATTNGLCSYQGDSTDPSASMSSDALKVFPNPVRPEYLGYVHITGLMSNSVVKIVSASGTLVTEGTSIGGEFSWNCCYATGKRVASGIYYALCTDENGKENACAKILVIK